MKQLSLAFLLFLVTIACAAQDYPHFGSLHGAIYSNHESGVQIHVPNGWTIAAPKEDESDSEAKEQLYLSLSKAAAPKTLIVFKGVKFEGTPSISADRSKSYADTFSDRADLSVTRDASLILVGGIDMYRTDLRSTDAAQPMLALLTVAIRDRIRVFEIHGSSQHELDDAVAMLSTHVFFDPAYQAPDVKNAAIAEVVNKTGDAAAFLRQATPLYPPQAKEAHVSGSLRFNVEFSKSGRVQRIWLVDESESLSSPTTQNAELQPLFVKSALDQLEKFKFSPPKRNGSAIPALTSININFTLE